MEQKDLFEASVERLPYVECTPAGRSGPLSVECAKKNIKTYPTWIIKGKVYKGVLQPDRLAAITGYSGSK